MVSDHYELNIVSLIVYTSISAIALVLDYSIYLISLELGLDAPISSIIGYVVGLVLAYVLMKNRVFKEGWLEEKRYLEFFGFLLSGVVGILLTYLAVFLTNALIPGSIHIAKINAVIISFVGVLLFRKCVVFRKRKSDSV